MQTELGETALELDPCVATSWVLTLGWEKIRKKIVSCDSCGGSQSGGGNPCNYPISSKGSGSFVR
jgi:hypothetical protein